MCLTLGLLAVMSGLLNNTQFCYRVSHPKYLTKSLSLQKHDQFDIQMLNTPALYAIEVYCQVFMLNGVSPDDFEDGDIRIRFKFLDYACVEIEKAAEEQSGATSTTGTSSPWSSTPTTPTTPGTPGKPGTPGGVVTPGTPGVETEPTLSATPGAPLEGSSKMDGLTPSMRSQLQGLKTDKAGTSGTTVPQQQVPLQQDGNTAVVDGQVGSPSTPADSTAPPSESVSSPTQSSPSPSTKKRHRQKDSRYFDPKKLLKQNQPPPLAEPQSAGETAPTDQSNGANTEAVTGVTAEGSKTEAKTTSKTGTKAGDGSKTSDLKTPSKNAAGSSGKLPDSVGKTTEADGSQMTDTENSTITDVPGDTTIPPTDLAMTEYEEDFGEEQSSELDDRSNALFFENGKSLIFCTIPLNLLYSLPRHPLVVIFFRPPSEVLGIVRVDLSAFAAGVDSSIILTKSIPLSVERNDTFDIVSRGRTVGWADLYVRLSCFGPFLMHKIFLRDNPNEKETPEARTRRTASDRLIVVQVSVANLGLVRNKSKLFVSKSNPSLVGRVTRDISNLPAIVCADENLISAPARPKPELTIVEEEEMEREQRRRENLSRFPQYKCIDDWEVVFNRQVIKDLIAKNRRPFQVGSPDRTYVESYFPELMPGCHQQPKTKSESENEKDQKPSKKRKVGKKSSEDGPSLNYLKLDEAWLKENNLQRIQRKSVRPAVRTSIVEEDGPMKSGPSGASSTLKLPAHTMTSMSHVAVHHFDMERNDYTADSRIFPPDGKHSRSVSPERSRITPLDYRVDLKNASNVAVFHFDPFKKTAGKQQNRNLESLDATSSRQFRAGPIFNTRHPRVDSTLEKFNPIPGRPVAIEIRAPERSPADRLVQAIRQIGDEVDAMGGDTKMLHSVYQDYASLEGSERHIPDHMKRGKTPDEASRVLSGSLEPILIEVDKGVPLAVPARGTPYWEGHAPVCSDPTNCPHFLFLHPGFGYYGR